MKKCVTVLLICALALLCGCQKNTEEPVETAPPLSVATAQQALDTAMASATEEGEEVPAYLKELDKRTSWTVLSAEDGDGIGQATVKVSAPDLYGVIKSLEQEVFPDTQAMDSAVTEALRTAPLREQELVVEFQLDGIRWEALLSEEFADACYGGLLTYRTELYASLEGVLLQ